jgi:hypothetical protein
LAVKSGRFTSETSLLRQSLKNLTIYASSPRGVAGDAQHRPALVCELHFLIEDANAVDFRARDEEELLVGVGGEVPEASPTTFTSSTRS